VSTELTTTRPPLPAYISLENPFVSRIGDIEIDGYSPRSLKVLLAGWKTWRKACDVAGVPPLPADERVLLAEVQRRVQSGHSRATIETTLFFPLRAAHKRAKLPSPLDSDIFQDLWKKLCREKLTARQSQAAPLSDDHLKALAKVLSPERPRDCLLGALCGIAYDAMLRVSELVAIERSNLAMDSDGSAILLIARSKVDQEGKGASLYLRPETVEWVKTHLRHVRELQPEGAWIFPSPYGGGRKPISTRQAANLILDAGRRIGVEGLSGHSGRVGATQDMVIKGATLPQVQRRGRWKTVKQPARYAENAEAKVSGAAWAELLKN